MMAFRSSTLVGLLLLVALTFKEVGAQGLLAPPPVFPPPAPLLPPPPLLLTPPPSASPPPASVLAPPPPTPSLKPRPPVPAPAPVHTPKPAPGRAPRPAPAKAPQGFVSQGVNSVPGAASPVGPYGIAWTSTVTGLLLAMASGLVLVLA